MAADILEIAASSGVREIVDDYLSLFWELVQFSRLECERYQEKIRVPRELNRRRSLVCVFTHHLPVSTTCTYSGFPSMLASATRRVSSEVSGALDASCASAATGSGIPFL